MVNFSHVVCVASATKRCLLNGHKKYVSNMRQLVSKAQNTEDGGRVCALLDVAAEGPFLLQLRVLRQHRREQRQVAGAVLRDRGRQILERYAAVRGRDRHPRQHAVCRDVSGSQFQARVKCMQTVHARTLTTTHATAEQGV